MSGVGLDPSRKERLLKSLASDHFRNAQRLARRLVAAEIEIERLKGNAE